MGTLRKMKRGMVNPSPLDPKLMAAWNNGFDEGSKQQRKSDIEITVKILEGLEEIHGIGEKTAWKIREHVMSKFGK